MMWPNAAVIFVLSIVAARGQNLDVRHNNPSDVALLQEQEVVVLDTASHLDAKTVKQSTGKAAANSTQSEAAVKAVAALGKQAVKADAKAVANAAKEGHTAVATASEEALKANKASKATMSKAPAKAAGKAARKAAKTSVLRKAAAKIATSAVKAAEKAFAKGKRSKRAKVCPRGKPAKLAKAVKCQVAKARAKEARLRVEVSDIVARTLEKQGEQAAAIKKGVAKAVASAAGQARDIARNIIAKHTRDVANNLASHTHMVADTLAKHTQQVADRLAKHTLDVAHRLAAAKRAARQAKSAASAAASAAYAITASQGQLPLPYIHRHAVTVHKVHRVRCPKTSEEAWVAVHAARKRWAKAWVAAQPAYSALGLQPPCHP